MSNAINRIGNGTSPSGIPFVNPNQDTLDKISQQNNQLLFNNKKLGKPLTIIESNTNQSSTSSDSDSSYYKRFDNVQKIIFHGANVQVNPYNNKQVYVNVTKVQDIIDQKDNIITNYFNIRTINSSEYQMKNKDFVLCNNLNGNTILKLPKNAEDKSYIKIATLENINSENKVTITVSQPYIFISKTNNTTLQIDTPYSSIQLIFDYAYKIWRVITPFVPIQRSTVGITQLQVKKMTKKYLNIFG